MVRALAQLALAFVLFASSAHAYAPSPGVHAIETIDGEWSDAARFDRRVPYRLFLPKDQTEAAPVVIFSHGLGGTRDAARYLGERLAASGYAAVHIQHPGSDRSIWEGATTEPEILARMTASLTDLRNAVNRFEDVPFAIDSLEAMAREGPLAGRLDPSRIGMSGHSYGAVSTLVAVGQRLGPFGILSYADPRIDAAIAYSPSAPRRGDPARVLRDVRTPLFHMTGTEDRTPFDAGAAPADRTIPYRVISGAPQHLLVLEGGDHMVFNGARLRGEARASDARFHALIADASLAFWDAYLKGDAEAKAWLDGGGFAQAVGEAGTYERKD